jgi:Fe-S cluster biogenesis protein NfuA
MIGIGRTKRSSEEIERQIARELAEVTPLLGIDACGIELTSFDDATGVAQIHFVGECTHCEASAATFMPGIETRLKLKVAELQEIRIEKAPR